MNNLLEEEDVLYKMRRETCRRGKILY